MASDSTEVATLGGGCFWCLEAVFEELRGVETVVNGYAGGNVPRPSYEAVCTGETGHAEVVQVTFDPRQLSYQELLEVFFTIHDPTTPNRQGADVGPQYRSIVLYHSPAQKRTAEDVVRGFESSGELDGRIVTQIRALEEFHPAEAYHQGYYRRNPSQGYCRMVISPKMGKFRSRWKSRLKSADVSAK